MQKLVQMYISFESQVIESTTKMFNFSNVPSLQRRPQYIPNPSGILDYFSRIPCHQYPENTFSESTINKLLIDYESNYSSAKVFSKISFLLGGSLVGLGMTRYVWRPARVKPLQYLILPLMSALMTFSIVYPKTTVDTLGFICASLGTKASSWKTALEDSFKDAKVRFSKRERED